MSRILIVEDELHIAEGLRFNLEAEGYEVTNVDTGEAGVGLGQATRLRSPGARRHAAGHERFRRRAATPRTRASSCRS